MAGYNILNYIFYYCLNCAEVVEKRILTQVEILNAVWQRKHLWMGHVLRHDGLLHKITEGRMKGKLAKRRRRLQMLHDQRKSDGYAVLTRAEERKESCQQTCSIAENYTEVKKVMSRHLV